MVRRVSALSQVLKEKEAETTPSENSIPALPQNDNKTKQESSNTAKQQPTKTQERDKITYYLDPGQFDKLEDMRIAYKKATGTRFNDQEFMRFIVDRLELHILL